MRAWKYLVLIAGIVGVAGFFLPFVELHSEPAKLDGLVSAYQVVRGIDDVRDLIAGTKPLAMQADPAVQRTIAELNRRLAEYRGVMVAFYVPAALLALLGALAGIRRRMGRLAGLCAILFGGASGVVWLLFDHVSRESAAKAAASGTSAVMGYGLHALLVAALFGVIAGLGAFLLPDRGVAEARA